MAFRRSLPPVPQRPVIVLLAEHHDDSRETLARDLEREGALVDAVADGEAALERMISQRFRPDVVVSDLRLPHRNGLNVLAELRGTGLTTPFVLLARSTDAIDPDAVATFGAAVVLPKPLHFEELRRTLRRLVSTTRWNGSRTAEKPR